MREPAEAVGQTDQQQLGIGMEVEKLAAGGITSIAGLEVAQRNFSDGFKYIFEDGSWLLIRPSGTEPVLRLYSEAGDPAKVALLLEAARGIAGIR